MSRATRDVIVEIDHILLAVPDPEATAARLAAVLGLPAAGGGAHPGIGTRNALLSLRGPYLELIGPLDESPEAAERARHHPIGRAVRAALHAPSTPGPTGTSPDPIRGLASATGGYASVALRSDDVAGDVARLGAAASPLVADVVVRARPDGSLITWPVAFPPRLGPDDPGFLIEHAPDEPERSARLGAPGPHLVALSVAVSDPAAVASAWEATLGVRFAHPTPGPRDASDAWVATLGLHRIELRSAVGTDEGRPHATIMLAGSDGDGRAASVGDARIELR